MSADNTLILSATTYRRLHRYARGPMTKGGVPHPGGLVALPIDADIVARVAELRGPDETDEDVILRMMNAWDVAEKEKKS